MNAPRFTLGAANSTGNSANSKAMEPLVYTWDFSAGQFGWIGDFSDYPVGEEEFFELESGVRSLPESVGDESALFITGSNRSDELFMYFRNDISGLMPTTYDVVFDIELASSAPDGRFGIGGSPANSVYLKAGVTETEPVPLPTDWEGDFYRLNVDKGGQSQAGADSIVLGDIAKPPGDDDLDYSLITRDNADTPFQFTAERDDAWLYFGTDSGFEGTTALYYTRFQATFTPVDNATPVPQASASLGLVMLGILFGLQQAYRAIQRLNA